MTPADATLPREWCPVPGSCHRLAATGLEPIPELAPTQGYPRAWRSTGAVAPSARGGTEEAGRSAVGAPEEAGRAAVGAPEEAGRAVVGAPEAAGPW